MLRPKKRPPREEGWNTPGTQHEFPPWAVSAYQIALKHGFEGTERDFRMSLLGTDGIHMLPMLLVTDAEEDEIPDDYEIFMRPSSDGYAYYTTHNEFRTADEIVKVPDGLDLNERTMKLTCLGEPYGTGTLIPEAELPAVTAADNGKIFRVVNGQWVIYPEGTAILTDQASAVFSNGAADWPVMDLRISIKAKQTGYGDPSPENPHPITGWTKAVVKRKGANRFTAAGAAAGYAIDALGNIVETQGYMVTDYIDATGTPSMICMAYRGEEPWVTVYYRANLYDADGEFLRMANLSQIREDEWLVWEFETTGAAFIRFSCPQGTTADNTDLASVRTTISSFPSSAGTVYGGTLDVTTGELVVTHGHIASYDGETLPGEWISDRDVYEAGTSPSTGAEVVYALAEADWETYEADPKDVRTDLGENTIWADTGGILRLEYAVD